MFECLFCRYKVRKGVLLLSLLTCKWLINYIIIILEFIEGVSQFSVKGDKLSKLRCKYMYIIGKKKFGCK